MTHQRFELVNYRFRCEPHRGHGSSERKSLQRLRDSHEALGRVDFPVVDPLCIQRVDQSARRYDALLAYLNGGQWRTLRQRYGQLVYDPWMCAELGGTVRDCVTPGRKPNHGVGGLDLLEDLRRQCATENGLTMREPHRASTAL